MKLNLPESFAFFMRSINMGFLEESVINIREDKITCDAKNQEQTLLVYASMDYPYGKTLSFQDVEVKDAKGEIHTEKRNDMGIMSLTLLLRAFNNLEPFVVAVDNKAVKADLQAGSITLYDDNSNYKILLCRTSIIDVPFKLKPMEYDVSFKLPDSQVSSLLKGMNIILDPKFSIVSDEDVKIKIGTDVSNSYVEKVVSSVHKIGFSKTFVRDHVGAILSTHKGNSNITFSANERMLNINCVDSTIGLNVDYYLSAKKDMNA
jgi:hypothetical protein